ncbi:MAG: hypothetical protein RMJ59_01595 [Candidatus Nitrosocaldus sp.]|nr:hypothetical protein [Candidatus Nitrosocaldus sp.]MDW8275059.1 hypothetical protein [Candidatus Nitrosocaldus sp.]
MHISSFNKTRVFNMVLASLIIIYTVYLLSLFDLRFYTTVYRVTYPLVFEYMASEQYDTLFPIVISIFIYLIMDVKIGSVYSIISITLVLFALFIGEGFILNIVALATLPSFIFTAMVVLPCKTKIDVLKLLSSILTILVVFEFIVMLTWLSYTILNGNVYEGYHWAFARTETAVFYIMGSISPILALLILFAYLYKPAIPILISAYSSLIGYIRRRITRHNSEISINPIYNTRLTKDDRSLYNFSFYSPLSFLLNNSQHIFIAALILSILFAYYPYLPTINPAMENISVDVIYYIQGINEMTVDNSGINISKAFTISNGDRPLSLLFMLAIYNMINVFGNIELSVALRFMPLVLAPLLTYVVYRFTITLYTNKFIAAMASLLTIFSYHFIVGIYAGFFANWLALIVMYATLTLLLMYIRTGRILHLLYMFLCLEVVMLLHVYTWTYLIAGLLLFTLVTLIVYKLVGKKEQDVGIDLKRYIFILLIVAASVFIDIARAEVLNVFSGVETNVILADKGVGYEQFLARWNNLKYTFTTYVGGYFTNVPLLLLTLIWIIRANIKTVEDRLILSMIYIGSFAVIFGDYVIQTRIFYNLPLHIAGAAGISMLLASYIHQDYDKTLIKRRGDRSMLLLLVSMLFLLVMVNYTLRALSNLVFRF